MTQTPTTNTVTDSDSEAPALSDRKTERRNSILQHAAKLFARDGYADCEMERVAAESGIAKGTLYLYFRSKEELFCACVDQGMRELQASVQTAASQHTAALEKISAGILAYLLFFETHPEQAELLIHERASFHDRLTPTYFMYREESRERWRTVWAELLQNGTLRRELKVDQVLDFIGNLVYGTMFTNHFLGRSAKDQHAVIMEILLRGLLAPN
ncbi:MAG: TetR/AcrR family transcriptional regulator [Planctomyces sp.]|nr:TetR/AcrR family transcriptional regulator [Planctomyces sp.]